MSEHERYMKLALKEAQKAFDKDEVPIGAVIVKDGRVIARAYNKREEKNMATAHAEILVLEKACKKLNSWRLSNCDMYVTVEPCPMCAGALLNARINYLYFGTEDKKSGAVISNLNSLDLDKTFCNHKVHYEGGVLEKECKSIVQNFFKKLRTRKDNAVVRKN